MSTQTANFAWYIPAHGETDWDKINTGLQTFVHYWIHEIDAFLGQGFVTIRGAVDHPENSRLTAWKGNTWIWASGSASLEYVPDFYNGETIPYGPYADPVPAVLSESGLFAIQPDPDSPWNVAGFLVIPGHVGPYGEHGGSGGWDSYPSPLGGIVDYDNGWASFRVGSWSEGISGALVVSGPKPITLDSVNGEIHFGFTSGYVGYDGTTKEILFGVREAGGASAELCDGFTDPPTLTWNGSAYEITLCPFKIGDVNYYDTLTGLPPAPIIMFFANELHSPSGVIAIAADGDELVSLPNVFHGNDDIDLLLLDSKTGPEHIQILVPNAQVAELWGYIESQYDLILLAESVFITGGTDVDYTYNPDAFGGLIDWQAKIEILVGGALEVKQDLYISDNYKFLGRHKIPVLSGDYPKNLVPAVPDRGEVFYIPRDSTYGIMDDMFLIKKINSGEWCAIAASDIVIDFVPQLFWSEDLEMYFANVFTATKTGEGGAIDFDQYPNWLHGLPAVESGGRESYCTYINADSGANITALKVVGGFGTHVMERAVWIDPVAFGISGTGPAVMKLLLAYDLVNEIYCSFVCVSGSATYATTALENIPNILVAASYDIFSRTNGSTDFTVTTSTGDMAIIGTDGDNDERSFPLHRISGPIIEGGGGSYTSACAIITHNGTLYSESLDGDADALYSYFVKPPFMTSGVKIKMGSPQASDTSSQGPQDLTGVDVDGINNIDAVVAVAQGQNVTLYCAAPNTAALLVELEAGQPGAVKETFYDIAVFSVDHYEYSRLPFLTLPDADFWGGNGIGVNDSE